METRLEQQLKRGVLEMVVLRLVSEKPAHGYELILRLRRSAGGQLAVREGTLYPILYRLEDDGFVESRWSEAQGKKVPRKYYAITAEGTCALSELEALWREICDAAGLIMEGDYDE